MLYGLSRRVIAAWHLEGMTDGGTAWQTPGAKSMPGQPGPYATPPTIGAGAMGLCLQFDSSDRQYVDCANLPVYNQSEGIRLEAHVRPGGAGAAVNDVLSVISKSDGASGSFLALGCTSVSPELYTVHGRFYVRDDDGTNVSLLLSSYNATSSTGMQLPAGTWHHVAAEFDGFEARLYVDGVLVDLDSYRSPEDTGDPATSNPVPDPNTGGGAPPDLLFTPPARIVLPRSVNLIIGGGYVDCPQGTSSNAYFRGSIDEPKLLSVAGGGRVELPERVALYSTDPVIHFDGQGFLAPAHHWSDAFVAVGDPYQAASLESDNGTDLVLPEAHPFSATGGWVLINDELVYYSGISAPPGPALTGLLTPRGLARTVAAHSSGDEVYFARVLRINQAGVISRMTERP
jgi:hypothetical protein